MPFVTRQLRGQISAILRAIRPSSTPSFSRHTCDIVGESPKPQRQQREARGATRGADLRPQVTPSVNGVRTRSMFGAHFGRGYDRQPRRGPGDVSQRACWVDDPRLSCQWLRCPIRFRVRSTPGRPDHPLGPGSLRTRPRSGWCLQRSTVSPWLFLGRS